MNHPENTYPSFDILVERTSRNDNRPLLRGNVAEKLKIPEDISLGVPVITIYGNHEVYLENYRRILVYEKNCIKVQAKGCCIQFTGKNLEILYYTNVDMKIVGEFKEVRYCL